MIIFNSFIFFVIFFLAKYDFARGGQLARLYHHSNVSVGMEFEVGLSDRRKAPLCGNDGGQFVSRGGKFVLDRRNDVIARGVSIMERRTEMAKPGLEKRAKLERKHSKTTAALKRSSSKVTKPKKATGNAKAPVRKLFLDEDGQELLFFTSSAAKTLVGKIAYDEYGKGKRIKKDITESEEEMKKAGKGYGGGRRSRGRSGRGRKG